MHDSTQWTYGVRYALLGFLGMKPGDIHVRRLFTGGDFGAESYVWPHQILTPSLRASRDGPSRSR